MAFQRMTSVLARVSILVLAAIPAQAGTVTFPEVWNTIDRSSPAQEASRLQTEGVVESQARASKHWLPRIYLDAKSYQTNDPGSSFFGLLEQRRVEAADFNPDSLNHPDSKLFTRGALGLDLALYEGGMKVSQVAMLEHAVMAQKLTTSQIQVEQYAQAGLSYGSIAILTRQQQKLRDLGDELKRLLKNYQLGQKSNPVGYSGLLGMKSVANRIAGLIDQYEAQRKAYSSALAEMGYKAESWSPESLDAKMFVDKYLASPLSGPTEPSFQTAANLENVKASASGAEMERARYLPRVGAFAETFVFHGDRDTANGYTAGLYLQWNLFDPSDSGKWKEAKLRAAAAQKQSDASVQMENAERAALNESMTALRSNLSLLQDSDHLLAEQARMSSTLFRNGSISALQFVEIVNRRADLIAQQADAELSLIKAASSALTKSRFEISNHISGGGMK